MSAASMCTVTASTKRSTATLGRYAAPATYLASLLITPLWPVSKELANQAALNSPRDYRECYHVPASGTTLPDVKEGDVLVIGSNEYPISYVAEWTDGVVPTLNIVVQEVR